MKNEHPDWTAEEERLQKELTGFRPVAPSPDLKDRIRQAALQEFGQIPTAPAKDKVKLFPRLAPWVSVAALFMICVFGVAMFLDKYNVVSPGEATWQPASLAGNGGGQVTEQPSPEIMKNLPPGIQGAFSDPNQKFVGQELDGVIETEDGQPMVKMRLKFLRTFMKKDPDTGKETLEEVPEEHLLIVPVEHD